MIWNRTLAGIILVIVMLISIVYMLIKKKQLSKGIEYFISAISLLTLIEITIMIGKSYDDDFQTLLYYIIGVNFFVFLLFFLFFQAILNVSRLRRINLIIISLFILNYVFSAIFIDDFFEVFPFLSYFTQVVLLIGSIFLVISQTFNSDKILAISTYFPFWICLSLLVIYLGVLPLMIVSITAANFMNLNIFYAILFLVNFIGYCILIVGVYKAKEES